MKAQEYAKQENIENVDCEIRNLDCISNVFNFSYCNWVCHPLNLPPGSTPGFMYH